MFLWAVFQNICLANTFQKCYMVFPFFNCPHKEYLPQTPVQYHKEYLSHLVEIAFVSMRVFT